MSPTTALVQVAATTFDFANNMAYTVLGPEFEQNMRRLLHKLAEHGFLLFGFGDTPFLMPEPSLLPVANPIPLKRLPPLLRYMSKAKKSMLRATYARGTVLFPPGSAQLPLSQRFLAAPITLYGPDGAVNVALRPQAAQIGLGHEYLPEPTPCPTPRLSTYANGQADVRATLRGATAVLEALVRGAVDEEWLQAPAIESKHLSAPPMTRSYARRSPAPNSAPRMVTRSYAQPGSKVAQEVEASGRLGRASRQSTDSGSSGARTPNSQDASIVNMGREKMK